MSPSRSLGETPVIEFVLRGNPRGTSTSKSLGGHILSTLSANTKARNEPLKSFGETPITIVVRTQYEKRSTAG
eukprot:10896560-Alexandrium_andersonii.AAC.1